MPCTKLGRLVQQVRHLLADMAVCVHSAVQQEAAALKGLGQAATTGVQAALAGQLAGALEAACQLMQLHLSGYAQLDGILCSCS